MNILIIDDDSDVCDILSHAVTSHGHSARTVHSLGHGLKELEDYYPEVVLLDVCLPDGNGVDYLDSFFMSHCSPEVLVMTGKGDPDSAEKALLHGAFDYIQKPISIDNILIPIDRARDFRHARLERERAENFQREGIVGEGKAIKDCLNQIAEAAGTENSVLISGETGTGKELFARALHNNSPRADGYLVVVDCAALTETLVESTLFGHIKGSFTGAMQDQEGLLQKGHKGTVFLDEVGELSQEMQKKFLRAMEEKRFRPLGSKKEVFSDFRVVAATNRHLQAMAGEGNFRQDLLQRLKTYFIGVPSLRERKEDIPLLLDYYLQKICARMQIPVKEYYQEVLEIFSEYDWPGNVREFLHAVEVAVSASKLESHLHRKHLPLHIRTEVLRNSISSKSGEGSLISEIASPLASEQVPDWKTYRHSILEGAEVKYYWDLYNYTGGDIKELARIAGVTKSRIYEILKKHQIAYHKSSSN